MGTKGSTIVDPDIQYEPAAQNMTSQKPVEKPGEVKEDIRMEIWKERTEKKDVYIERRDALEKKMGTDVENQKKRDEERRKAEEANIEQRRTAGPEKLEDADKQERERKEGEEKARAAQARVEERTEEEDKAEDYPKDSTEENKPQWTSPMDDRDEVDDRSDEERAEDEKREEGQPKRPIPRIPPAPRKK